MEDEVRFELTILVLQTRALTTWLLTLCINGPPTRTLTLNNGLEDRYDLQFHHERKYI